MKVAFYVVVVSALISCAFSYSSSKSCSCSNGVCNCEENTDPMGNVAGSSALSSSGPAGGYMYNQAGTGQSGSGVYSSQSSSMGAGSPPPFINPFSIFGGGFPFGGLGGFPGGGAFALAGRRR